MTLNGNSSAGVVVSILILVINAVFLFMNFIADKIHKCNNTQTLISIQLKNTGRVMLALASLASIVIIICAFAAYSSGSQIIKSQRPFYFIFLFLLLLSGMTAIVNLVFLSKEIQKHKNIINEFINDIGQQY